MRSAQVLGAVIVAVGLAACGIAAWYERPRPTSAPPSVSYNTSYELGEHSYGAEIGMPVRFKNVGRGPLRIWGFRSDSSCMAVESSARGPVQELTIDPGSEGSVTVRVVARGSGAQRSFLGFETNDPQHPQGRIDFVISRVIPAILFIPNTVGFGTVLVGQAAPVQRVELRDANAKPRSIRSVECHSPHVKFRWQPVAGAAPERNPFHEVMVGVIDVELDTSKPTRANAVIVVQLDDDKGTRMEIPVVGSVVAAVEITPAELPLPRASRQGKLFTATCHARSFQQRPFSFTLGKAPLPPGVSVQLPERPSPTAAQIIHVEVDPKTVVGETRHVIEFNAVLEQQSYTVPLVLVVRPE